MTTQKAKKPRMKKEDRKNQIFWADGARDDILRPHIPQYANALQQGWRQERDYLLGVFNEYHARISWRLEDWEEPPLPLPPYDPKAPFVEEELTPEEMGRKTARIEELNARIRRWMKYRARKLCKTFQSTNPKKNPYAVLLAKMSGVRNPPKARQGYQQFMRERYQDMIEPEVKKQWAKKSLQDGNAFAKAPGTGFRANVARDIFKTLPIRDQEQYRKRAQAEADQAKQAYEEALGAPPEQTREAYARAIDALPSVLAPLLQGLCDATNMKFAIIYGGPDPRYGGVVTTDVLTYGTSLTNSPMTWPQWDPKRFDEVINFYNEWLYTAYTASELEAAKATGPVPVISDKELLIFEEDNHDGFDAFGDEVNDNYAFDEEEGWREPDEDLDLNGGTATAHKKRPRAGTATGPNVPAKKKKADRPLPPTTSSVQPLPAETTPPRPTPQYSPYPSTDANGLIEPDWNNQAQVDAYVMARAQMPAPPYSPYPSKDANGLIEPDWNNKAQVDAYVMTRARMHMRQPGSQLQKGSPSVPENPPSPAVPPASMEPSPPPSFSFPPPSQTPVSAAQSAPPPLSEERDDWEMQDPTLSEPESEDDQRHPDPVLIPASFSTRLPPPLPPLPVPTAFYQPPVPDHPRSAVSSPSSTVANIPREVPRMNSSGATLEQGGISLEPQSSPPTSTSPSPSPSAADQSGSNLTTSNKPQSTRSRTVVVMPLCPSSAPAWFRDAHTGLTAVALNDTHYSELLQEYIALETAYEFTVAKPPMTLCKKSRPEILSNWIAGQRWRRKAQPIIEDPMAFADRWSSWYAALIPKWHDVTIARKPKHPPENRDQWLTLRVPGPNDLGSGGHGS